MNKQQYNILSDIFALNSFTLPILIVIFNSDYRQNHHGTYLFPLYVPLIVFITLFFIGFMLWRKGDHYE